MECTACDFSWFTNTVQTPATNLFNVIQGKSISSGTPNVFDVLNSFNQKPKSKDEVIQDPYFVNLYLQFPNPTIGRLAREITMGLSSDDEKVKAIQEWVVNNSQYMEEKDQYGYDELWVPPTMLLSQGAGDCEDGAFLIMSLALNAGVDPDRLRFYGGEVQAGSGARTGGHGWVAYQRHMDDEWVVLDFSYYPDLRHVNKQTPMKEDLKYIDQFFMFEVGEIITSEVNRVRNPDVRYDSRGYIQPNVLLPGTWINARA